MIDDIWHHCNGKVWRHIAPGLCSMCRHVGAAYVTPQDTIKKILDQIYKQAETIKDPNFVIERLLPIVEPENYQSGHDYQD
jgi:hypothetical protein